MVLVKSKSKSITKQKQKQRQTVIVNIDTKKTRSKRQPRQSPRKPKAGNSEIATNPLYYPSVIHAVQQPSPYTMHPQEIKDAIREAVRNITHASTKDQYIEQLQHTNVETPKQPVVPDLQQPAPIANVETISIVAEPAERERTPIETPKENQNQLVQYVGKAREKVASDNSRPYLQPINLKPQEVYNPFEGVGNIFNSPFAKLDQKTKRENALKAAEERLRKQNEQLVITQEPEQRPEAPQVINRLSEYSKANILKISKEAGVMLSTDERKQPLQNLLYNVSRRINPNDVNWDSYPKKIKK